MVSSGPIAVVGARGMLGRELCRQLAARGEAVDALDLEEVDVTSSSSVARCSALSRARLIFNCAAYTDVEKCEDELPAAMEVNGAGVRRLAEVARASGALLVHLSTDFVFDGALGHPYPVDATPAPLSAYGRSKLAGERALAEVGGRSLLVRTAWLYGQGGKNFIDTILRRAETQGRLEVVRDQVGSPTYARDLAEALIDLALAGHEGVFHCTNRGAASWYELAREVVRLAGLDVSLRPLTTAESIARFHLKAARPAYSVLDCSRLEAALGRRLRPWPEALADYLEARKGSLR